MSAREFGSYRKKWISFRGCQPLPGVQLVGTQREKQRVENKKSAVRGIFFIFRTAAQLTERLEEAKNVIDQINSF